MISRELALWGDRFYADPEIIIRIGAAMGLAWLQRGRRPLGLTLRADAMDAIFLQILNGLDKGGAYALIALGLTLVFGTLGVVNFAHGALFMLGAFCAVTRQASSCLLARKSQQKTPVWASRRRLKSYLMSKSGSATATGSFDNQLLRADIDPADDSGHVPYRHCHGTRPHQAFLQAPSC